MKTESHLLLAKISFSIIMKLATTNLQISKSNGLYSPRSRLLSIKLKISKIRKLLEFQIISELSIVFLLFGHILISVVLWPNG